MSLTSALYQSTKDLHREAETTGVIRMLLRGEASRDGYVLLLRNLHPAYAALEEGLADKLPALAGFAIARADAIAHDLAALAGADWRRTIALLPEGAAYAAAIDNAAQADGTRLIAHAYTRYLGDLSGGQILKRLLAKSLRLSNAQLSFYDFPQHDLAALKDDYRATLDEAGARAHDQDAIVAEGAEAFRHNIALSCAIAARLAGQDAAE